MITDRKFDNVENNVYVNGNSILNSVSLDDSEKIYLEEINKYNPLSSDEQKSLIAQKEKGDKDAFEKLVLCNLGIVVSIAKKYIGNGISLLDMIQEGNIGLVKGIEKYNSQKKCNFKSFISLYILRSIQKAFANQARTIRIPAYKVEEYNRLNKIKEKFISKYGYEPNSKQLAKIMNISLEKVEELTQIFMNPISLDKPTGDEKNFLSADSIPDENAISQAVEIENNMLKKQLLELIVNLRERERKVLLLRFGIEDGHPRTLEEVGMELNVGSERIRQIEDKALRKLKYRVKNLSYIIK